MALPHLVIRLNEVQDWAKVLSPGEQQRIAFARILLTKPKAVFLDESTSALDEGLELMLYQLVRTELPDTILVSVSHRSTVEQHHRQQLELLGDGEWRLGPSGHTRTVHVGPTSSGVTCRHGNVHPVPGLGHRDSSSLIWIAKAWAMAACGTLVVLFLLGRFTTWGRQFWRVTGAYFTGRESIRVWALLGVLLLSVMLSVRIDVLFSYYVNDQITALQVAF